LKTVGQLATGLAHELNQPLAAVCIQAEVARHLAAGSQDAKLSAALTEIVEQSHRAAAIVKTLRPAHSRCTSGQNIRCSPSIVTDV